MKITIKQIATVLTALFALLGAAYGLQEHFTPREVTEMMIAGVQKNQLQIQKNSQITNAQNWLMFWTMKVNGLQQECNANPNNRVKAQELNEAKRQRNIWQQEVNRLMVP